MCCVGATSVGKTSFMLMLKDNAFPENARMFFNLIFNFLLSSSRYELVKSGILIDFFFQFSLIYTTANPGEIEEFPIKMDVNGTAVEITCTDTGSTVCIRLLTFFALRTKKESQISYSFVLKHLG